MRKSSPVATVALLLEALKFPRTFSVEVFSIAISSELSAEHFHMEIYAPITSLEVLPCGSPHLKIKSFFDFEGRRSMRPGELYECLEELPPAMHVGFNIEFKNEPDLQRFTLNHRRLQTVSFELFPSRLSAGLHNRDGSPAVFIDIGRPL